MMKKTGIFYSFEAKNTSKIATIIEQKISTIFGIEKIDKLNIEEIDEETFLQYDNIICGLSTWFDGELPTRWDEFIPTIEELNMKGKTIAIFGIGDQVKYPENFVDSIGIIGNIFEERKAKLIGFTSVEGYTFEESKGVRDSKFMGLAIDIENQSHLTEQRVGNWLKQIKKQFT